MQNYKMIVCYNWESFRNQIELIKFIDKKIGSLARKRDRVGIRIQCFLFQVIEFFIDLYMIYRCSFFLFSVKCIETDYIKYKVKVFVILNFGDDY